MEEFLKVFGLVIFGIVIYAAVQVWKKAKAEGFDAKKFFGANKVFWLACIFLNLLISIGLVFVNGFEAIVHSLGFAVDADSHAGYVLLGIALAIGSDKTKITGTKTLNTSNA